jgi:hypothetical protein
LVFRDYGLTWDEPLFYKYADALGYAYTPSNWFSGSFDLNQSYGPSGDDHKTRGPGYLLLGRGPVGILESLGLDEPSAWHLANFTTFVLGVYFVYRLCSLFASDATAVAAAALFAFQPLLWGHAFINPKDMPFLVFLTGAIWLGFRMVDRMASTEKRSIWSSLSAIVLPGILLGLASSNRVLGPLGGLIVVAYFLARRISIRQGVWILLYAVLACLVMVATWPYLWETPRRFFDIFQFMSDNPTVLPVLFADQVYRAYELPRRYLPFYLLSTLTETVWPLFLFGLFAAAVTLKRNSVRLAAAALVLAWLVVPVAYVVVQRPPAYDGMRHFLFVLPPIFVFCGMGLDWLLVHVRRIWLGLTIVVLIIAPGTFGIVTLHPYEYAYYNSFVGGTGGAFRHYETDYWLTCYKEAVERLNLSTSAPVRLFVHREAPTAAPYAASNVSVLDERGQVSSIHSGDLVLVNTRTNEDRQTFRNAPPLFTIGRAGATFCVVKGVP